jgi:hypothetical protein
MFTFVFCIFIFSHLFNLINCRKIGAADTNVFENFFHNWIFLAIFVGIAAGQVVLVNLFYGLINVVPLTRSEWGACITIGALTLIIAFVLKFTPGKWVEFLDASVIGVDEDNTDQHALSAQVANITGGRLEIPGVNAEVAPETEMGELADPTEDIEGNPKTDDGYDKQA